MPAIFNSNAGTLFTRILVCLFASAACAAAQIDLTPTVTKRLHEGIEFPQLEFSDGGAKIVYEAPRNWRHVARGPRLLQLSPPEKTQANATIEVVAEALPAFDEPGVEMLKQQMLAFLPPQSEQPAITNVQPNPLMLDGRQTCEVVASFVRYGQRHKMSILFVNLGASQLRFTLLSQERDFSALHQAFRSTFASWQRIQPRPNAAATGAELALRLDDLLRAQSERRRLMSAS